MDFAAVYSHKSQETELFRRNGSANTKELIENLALCRRKTEEFFNEMLKNGNFLGFLRFLSSF